MARVHTKTALDTLAGISRSSNSDPARVAAAVALLNRGWGIPKSEEQHDKEGLRVTVRHLYENPPSKPSSDK